VRRGSTIPAAVVFVGIVAYCLLWPLVSTYGANEVDFAVSREGPSLAHPFGTDQFGRDLLTRLAVGGRTSFLIAGIALGIILVIGVLYGTAAAIAGRRLDGLLMRIVDGLFAIPRLPVAIVVLVALKLNAQNELTVAFALSIVGWMLTARLVRAQVRGLRSRDYVRAARALGAGWLQITRRHLLPNSTGIIVIAILLELPTVILGEAFLSILGLGSEAPTATWGNIAEQGMRFSRIWEMFLASAVIVAFALSANVLADALHDVIDPRRRTARAPATESAAPAAELA
jgi:ABC-type dipeptide/oligopeptide/nickel transport system permease subunit